MRKLLIILSVLFTTIVQAQTVNTDPTAFPFPTLSEALNTSMQTGVRFSTIQNGVLGTFTVVDRGSLKQDSGIVWYKGTTQAIVRDTSQATGGFDFRWFGLTPDDTTTVTRIKNRKILNKLASDSVTYFDYLIKGGAYYVDSSIVLNKYVHIHGANGYEMIDRGNMAKICYPKGITGIIANNNNASSSIIEGFMLQGVLPSGGRIVDYNSDDGNILALTPLIPAVTGQVYEVADAYHAEVVKGTFTLNTVGTTGFDYDIEFIQPYGKFHVGDTVTGSTTNAKAIVAYVSKHYNVIVCKQITAYTGWNKKFESIKNGKGDTAVFYALPTPTRFQFARVLHITTTSGTIDNPTTDSSLIGLQDSTHLDSLTFNTSGVLDTIGLSGKRLNVFREQGTYCYGILDQRRIEVRQMTIMNFGGEGVLVTNLIKPFTNANLSRFEYCKINANGGSGIKVEGGDANHLTIINSTFVGNNGFAIIDLSFLGISVAFTHSSLNACGSYTSANYLNRNSTWLNPYSEGGYALAPFPTVSNYLSGGALALGGTWGAPADDAYWRTDGYSGSWLDNKHLQNIDIYTDQTVGGRSVVFKGAGSTPHPVTVEARGNPGVGRGPAIRYAGPYGGAGWQGPVELKNGTIPYGEIQSTTVSGGAYDFAMKLRRNTPPVATVTDLKGKGKGAFVLINTLGGKVVSTEVLTGGKSYSIDSTVITIANPTDTVVGHKAVLIPYIEDSVLVGIYVKDSGLTYLDDDLTNTFEFASNGIIRNMTGTGQLGDATHPFTLYGSLVSVGGGGPFVYPDSLVAKTGTASTGATSMLRLYATGNYAIGRGPSMDFYGPNGLTNPQLASMQYVYDAANNPSFNLNMYDNAVTPNTILYANKNQVAINTTTPNASAVFQVHSTDRGSIPAPRMTSTQVNAVASKTGGLLYYNRTKQRYMYYDSTVSKDVLIPVTDTTAMADYKVLIGDAANDRFNKGDINAGTGISITKTTSGFTINNTATAGTAPQVKATAADVTNTTTTQADITGLNASVNANKVYSFTANLQVTATAGGVKIKLVVPTGTTFNLNVVCSNTTNTAPRVGVYNSTQTETFQIANAAFSGTSSAVIHISGVIQTSSTAGTIQLQFADFNASTTEIINAGSSIVVEEGQ